MSRRAKLLEKMRTDPGGIRFAEVVALLLAEGFVRSNAKGSHRIFRRPADGRIVTLVKPHGGRKTCHAKEIRKMLAELGR